MECNKENHIGLPRCLRIYTEIYLVISSTFEFTF